jgi:DNA-binding response OmpR family regulator
MAGHVLIVEREDYTTRKISEYTHTLGLRITSAKNGQLGLIAMRRDRPDVIILSDTLQDTDPEAFLARLSKFEEGKKVRVMALSSSSEGDRAAAMKKIGISHVLSKPVQLEQYRKGLADLLGLSMSTSKHLNYEVFLRDDIIMIELGGHLVPHDLVALKYMILDTARAHKSGKKRFFLIIYSLEEESLSQERFDAIFNFVQYFPKTPPEDVKILTTDADVRKIIASSGVAGRFEVMEDYVHGLKKLKSQFLQGDKQIIRVRFLQPLTTLYQDVYDESGNRIKEKGKSFTQEEIDGLLKRGVETLSYQRTARVDEEHQIVSDEDVDIVMDAIQLTGVVVPEGTRRIGDTQDTKKRLAQNVLIVNSDEAEMVTLYDFFTARSIPVHRAKSGAETRSLLKERLFDFCIVDLDLEDENGLDLIRFMKEKGGSRQFIVTGRKVPADIVRRAMSLGVRGFLTLPVDVNRLSSLFPLS